MVRLGMTFLPQPKLPSVTSYRTFPGAVVPLCCDDVRLRSRAPAYSPGPRTDFLLMPGGTALVAKFVFTAGCEGRLAGEIRADADHHGRQSDCRTLAVFIYDPLGFLRPAERLEAAWSALTGKLGGIVPNFGAKPETNTTTLPAKHAAPVVSPEMLAPLPPERPAAIEAAVLAAPADDPAPLETTGDVPLPPPAGAPPCWPPRGRWPSRSRTSTWRRCCRSRRAGPTTCTR